MQTPRPTHQDRGHRGQAFLLLSRLGDQGDTPPLGESFRLGLVGHDIESSIHVSHDRAYLRVIPVPQEDDMIPLVRKGVREVLSPADKGTGRVDDTNALPPQLLQDRAGLPVGAYQHLGSRRDLGCILRHPQPHGPETCALLGIVDRHADRPDRPFLLPCRQSLQNRIYGTLHAEAETGALGHHNLLQITSIQTSRPISGQIPVPASQRAPQAPPRDPSR